MPKRLSREIVSASLQVPSLRLADRKRAANEERINHDAFWAPLRAGAAFSADHAATRDRSKSRSLTQRS